MKFSRKKQGGFTLVELVVVLAIIVAVPLGLLGSSNIAPAWIQQPVRRVLDLIRSIPDLVVAVIFITAVGLGPFAGVMAMITVIMVRFRSMASRTCTPPEVV